MKKIYLFILISCSLVIFTSCEDKVEVKTTDLLGMWINKYDANDTIIFSNDMSQPIFEVKRGKEILGENYIPKSGSGFYWYEIRKDTIFVNYMLSSMGAKLSYHIDINKEKDEFIVNGNFTFYPSGEMQFTYKKVK